MEERLVAVLGNITAKEFEVAVAEIERRRRIEEYEEKTQIAMEILASAEKAISELGVKLTIPNGYYRINEEFKLGRVSPIDYYALKYL